LDVKKEKKLAAKFLKSKDSEQNKRSEKHSSSSKKKQNRIVRWWKSTVGELRKVSWPTPQEAWRLTKVVLVVVFVMAAILGLLDFVFSRVIAALVAL
jgi:preprotein translocase subunit SecE